MRRMITDKDVREESLKGLEELGNPENGQVLTYTESGVSWEDAAGGDDIHITYIDQPISGTLAVWQFKPATTTQKLEIQFLNSYQWTIKNSGGYTINIDTSINFPQYRGISIQGNSGSAGKVIGKDSNNQLAWLDSIPLCPTTTDGTFVLKCTISSGVATYSWVAE